MHMGRTLWGATYDCGQPRIRNAILSFAVQKLLCVPDDNSGRPFLTTGQEALFVAALLLISRAKPWLLTSTARCTFPMTPRGIMIWQIKRYSKEPTWSLGSADTHKNLTLCVYAEPRDPLRSWADNTQIDRFHYFEMKIRVLIRVKGIPRYRVQEDEGERKKRLMTENGRRSSFISFVSKVWNASDVYAFLN